MLKTLLKKLLVYVLTIEARLVLRKYKPKIIAVTGSVGKTSTKDSIYIVLSKSMHVRKSEKSFNSEIGIPLTILGCPNAWYNPFLWGRNIIDGILLLVLKNHYPQWLILEVGADRPGDIKHITSWLTPDIVILTRIPDVPVHVEFFASSEEVAKEKEYLVQALREDGVLIYNHDDLKVTKMAEAFRGESISYGMIPSAEVVGKGDQILYKEGRPEGISFRIEHKGKSASVRLLGGIGQQFVYSALAAAATGISQGLNLIAMADTLGAYKPPAGRMRIIEGIKGSFIIDDSYNSSPVAASGALLTLKELSVTGKKIAVLGDMLELGIHTMDEHKKLGALAADVADVLCTVGVRARSIAEGALSAKMSPKKVFQYEESYRAGKELEQFLEEGDVVLVKGSQSIRMERVVEEIMANPMQKEKLLVRQEKEWLDK